MLITEAQQKLLLRLQDEIKHQYGVQLGFSSIWGSCLDEEADDFIIHEEGRTWVSGDHMEGEATAIHLIHPRDYDVERAGILVQAAPAAYCCHDGKCEAFLKRVLRGLEEGSLNANDFIEREVGEAVTKVTKLGERGAYAIRVEDGAWTHYSSVRLQQGEEEARKEVASNCAWFGREVQDAVWEMVKELHKGC